LTTYAFQQPLMAAFSVCVINSIARFAMFLILVIMVREIFKIAMPWKSIAKYSLASAVMGVMLFLLPHTDRVSMTLAWTGLGGIVYLAVLMAIDKESRGLPKAILQEIRGKKGSE
jgi:hypothetical protein